MLDDCMTNQHCKGHARAQIIPDAAHYRGCRRFWAAWRRQLPRYRPLQDSDGPSWLTFLGHMKDSLWSTDLFRCESATLRTHWVLVVMDQYTRRIAGVRRSSLPRRDSR